MFLLLYVRMYVCMYVCHYVDTFICLFAVCKKCSAAQYHAKKSEPEPLPRYDQESNWLILILSLGQIGVDCWKLTQVLEARGFRKPSEPKP